MDISIIYIIGITAAVFAFSYLIDYLKKKNIISTESLLFVAKMLDLSLSIIMELKLKNENYIIEIGEIVKNSVDYALSIYQDPENIKESAFQYAIKQCENFQIELTEKRKNILKELINFVVESRVIK